MSQLKKLSIQGIRSFGYMEEHVQVVTFLSPVTLIVGPNGTGKTTVIECLRYATTGELPPGSKQGGAFVFDPKMAGYSEVRGQVRLSFVDVTGKTMRVQRSLMASVKKSGVSMKTLEGLIVREGTDGAVHQITSRCMEIDREVITALGVPKSVLENVIFCHQEDSNWPLSEGKVLKSKFDDIFAATKYIKILETLRKTRQEKAQEVKLHRSEIIHLRRYKEKAASLRVSLEDNKLERDACIEKIHQIEEYLVPIEEKLKEITKDAKRVYEMQRIMDKLENQRKNTQERISELELLTASNQFSYLDDVNVIRCQFMQCDNDKFQNEMKLESKNHELDILTRKLKGFQMNLNEMTTSITKFNMEIESGENAKLKQSSDLKNAGILADIANPNAEQIMNAINSLKLAFDYKKKSFNERVIYFDTELSKLHSKTLYLQEKVSLDYTNLKSLEDEHNSINQKLLESQKCSQSLQTIENELKILDENVKSMDLNIEKLDFKTKIEGYEISQKTLTKEIDQCQQMLDKLLESSKLTMQLDIIKDNIASKQCQYERIKYRIGNKLSTLPNDPDDWKTDCEDKLRTFTQQVNVLQEEKHSLRSNLLSKEERKRIELQKYRDTEADIDKAKERISSLLSSKEEYEPALSKIQKSLEDKREEYGLLNGCENTYRKFIKRIEEQLKSESENVANCPLCFRQFTKQQECLDLIRDMKDEIKGLPKKKSSLDDDIKSCEIACERMSNLKPIIEKLDVQTSILSDLKKELGALDKEINDCRLQIIKNEQAISLTSEEMSKLDEILPDILSINRLNEEIKDLRRNQSVHELDSQRSEVSNESMEDVKTRRNQMKQELEIVNGQIKSIRDTYEKEINKLNECKQLFALKRDEKFIMTTATLNIEALTESKIKISTQISTLQNDVCENQKLIDNVMSEIKSLQAKKDEYVMSTKTNLDLENNKIESLIKLSEKIVEMDFVIKRCSDEVVPKRNLALSRKDEIESDMKNIELQIKDTSTHIQEYQDSLNKHEIVVRQLRDLLQLCEKRLEHNGILHLIELQSLEFRGLKVSDLVADEKSLRQQQDELLKQKHTNNGRLAGFDSLIADVENDLNEKCHQFADKNFMELMITINVLESACTDIDKYYSALDRAVMTYHSSKMDELNKIIRELWSTYKGNDIDYIEIRSEVDDESGAAKTRRSYNYRVVMMKSGISMDMRGRCSAGQKVLASIIIRLALAEAFGVQCGIISLDEPTTNLDRENIESLAFSLIEIIETRCMQKQFQLVIITHDEDFVEMLCRSNCVEKFYRIQKDDKGFSKIYSCDTTDFR
ncbi:hypothetical protein GJ496_003107 [Pomphorhynchus laevis]|nr:hypothetical protein GJ496_003107 [Pomphorhynchus laevis]